MSEKVTPATVCQGGHRLHVHYNYGSDHGGRVEQICIATHTMRPGSKVSMHMHQGDCSLCPGGHCHEPNITAVMTAAGELMLTFENFPPPLHVEGNDAGEPPRLISREGVKTVEEEEFERSVDTELDTFHIMRPSWETPADTPSRKEVFVLRAAECPNSADLIATVKAVRADVAVMKHLSDSLGLDVGDLVERVSLGRLDADGNEFAVVYDLTGLVKEGPGGGLS